MSAKLFEKPFKTGIVWKNVIALVLLHYFTLKIFYTETTLGSFLFHFFYAFIAGYGIVAGAHRLWSHRSFKANYKLQVLLIILQAICIQNNVIDWVRDHRVHHKYTETDADPYNSKRGFIFAHMGWSMLRKHPDIKKYGKNVYMDDIENDPLLKFQKKYYVPLVLIFAFLIPILITMYVFNITLLTSIYSCFARYIISLHIVCCTNSVAHVGSWKPYDKNISASDSLINGTFTFGEGWHNFHHTFPFDYKVSEQTKWRHNWGMIFIDCFAKIGWATDLKVASEDMIRKRVLRTGDGSHPYAIEAAKMNKKNDNNEVIKRGNEVYWGLGDDDIPMEDIKDIETIHKV